MIRVAFAQVPHRCVSVERQRSEVCLGLLEVRLSCRPLLCVREQGPDGQLRERHRADQWLIRQKRRIGETAEQDDGRGVQKTPGSSNRRTHRLESKA